MIRAFRVVFLPADGSPANAYQKTIRAKTLDGARKQAAAELRRAGYEAARGWEGAEVDNTRDASFEVFAE